MAGTPTPKRVPESRSFSYVDTLLVNDFSLRISYETANTTLPESINVTGQNNDGNYFVGAFQRAGNKNISFSSSFDIAVITAVLVEVEDIFAGNFSSDLPTVTEGAE